jgi:hypothetical protein
VIGLSNIRTKIRTRGRLILSVFLVAWMNAALQPCLMAMEFSPNEATSVSETAELDSHQGHSSDKAIHKDRACPHCPASTSHVSNTCAIAVVADCDILPEAKPGEKILKVDLSDEFGDAHSTYHYRASDPSPPVSLAASPERLKPTFVVGPAISIRDCVFLK